MATEIDAEVAELATRIPFINRLLAEKADLESRLVDVNVRLAEAQQLADEKVRAIKDKLEKPVREA